MECNAGEYLSTLGTIMAIVSISIILVSNNYNILFFGLGLLLLSLFPLILGDNVTYGDGIIWQ